MAAARARAPAAPSAQTVVGTRRAAKSPAPDSCNGRQKTLSSSQIAVTITTATNFCCHNHRQKYLSSQPLPQITVTITVITIGIVTNHCRNHRNESSSELPSQSSSRPFLSQSLLSLRGYDGRLTRISEHQKGEEVAKGNESTKLNGKTPAVTLKSVGVPTTSITMTRTQ